MAISVVCACGKKLAVKDELAGRRVRCPACQETLSIPKPDDEASDDDWDLNDSDEQQPSSSRKSRNEKKSTSAKPVAGKKKPRGKGPSGQSRGLVIGLSAAGGLVVATLLVWQLWPAKPVNNEAVAPAGNPPGTAEIATTETTPKTNAVEANQGSQPIGGAAPASTTAAATSAANVDGDLKLLQGPWHITDVVADAKEPAPPQMLAAMKLMTWTFAEDVLTMARPDGSTVSTVKLDPKQSPKTADLTRLDGADPKATAAGIYSLEGDSLTWCMSKAGNVRPKDFNPDQTLGQLVVKLRRGAAADGSATPAASGPQFDLKTWRQASAKLREMKVFSQLASRQDVGESGFPIGLTHCAMIDPPETTDGSITPELWTVMSSVSHLMVRTKSISDATLKQVAQHPGLLGLNISGRSTVSASGITELQKCSNLRSLYFDGIPVSMDLVTEVTELRELRFLGINQTPVTSEMVAAVVRLPKLESLGLNASGITDDDAVQIAMVTTLNTLLIDRTNLTDKGLAELKRLTGLTIVSMRGLAVSPAAVAEFEAALPKCRVLK